MAGTNGRQNGGERVLESRHLVGLFLGVVLLCGVFFTLGYVMGKTQYGVAQVSAAESPGSASAKQPGSSPVPTGAGAHEPQPADWDFYDNKNKQPPHLDPQKPSTASSSGPAGPPNSITPRRSDVPSPVAKSVPVSAPNSSTRYQPPPLAKGAIVLQLAALKREGDAVALADAVQQKRFPSFVVTSPSDSLYRVQVGPYTDLQAANQAKESLAHAGFNSIIKR